MRIRRQDLMALRLGVLLVMAGCAQATRVPPEQVATDVAVLRASLQDAFMAQEIYYSNPANKYTYASDAAPLARYRRQPDVALTIFEGTAQGWSGMARSASGYACVIYVGKVSKTPVTPRGTSATKASRSQSLEIACDAPPAN